MIENIIIRITDLPENIKKNLNLITLNDTTRGVRFEIEYVPNTKLLSFFGIIKEDELGLTDDISYLTFFNEIYLNLCNKLETENLQLTCVLQASPDSQGSLVFGRVNTNNNNNNKTILKG